MTRKLWHVFAIGALSCVWVVGLTAVVRAEPNSGNSTTVGEVGQETQVAQAIGGRKGLTGYERPGPRREARRGETVNSRSRPELDALGANVGGGFRLLPSFELQQLWDDNIFDQENNEESDFITRFVPRLRLTSEWENHGVSLDGGAAIGQYWDNSDENYEDYDIGASGRVDVLRSTNFRIRSRYEHTHEDRGSPDAVNGDEPTEVDIYLVGAELNHDFGRFNGTLGGSFGRITFDDVEDGNGNEIVEHDRDRNRSDVFLRVGYDINPSYEVFTVASYNDVEYDGDEIGTGIDRSNDGYSVVFGLDADFTGIVFGEFYIGYQDQSFDDGDLDDVDGVVGGADITWNVTELTTIGFSGESDIRQTSVDGASARLVFTGGIRADHELLRESASRGKRKHYP